MLMLAVAENTAASTIEQNPVTGFLESVGLDGRGAVVHVTDMGPMHGTVTVAVSSGEGSEPRLSISENGDTSVIWVDAGGNILYRKQEVFTQSWSSVLTVTSDAVAGTRAALVAAGDTAWVAYEVEDAGDREIEEAEIIDSAEPFLKSPVEIINGSQDADLRLFHEAGIVWVTWCDSATQIGWSEEDSSGVWSIGQTMTFDPADPGPTYVAIQDAVLAP